MNRDEQKTVQYLNHIQSPEDFKKIPVDQMSYVADEIRQELIRITSANGGHLASNLGVVELTMAIHRVFDTPKDHVIFDVGHQSYVHKMLTGRYGAMDTLRKPSGLSGFTKREESEHDCFGAGHSSTSLSAALGFAISDKLNDSDAYTVVVVGDGAYTGGMIHEALNNCHRKLNLIIIMNENEMSISKNIGRFAKNLSKLRTKSGYFRTKRATGVFLKKIPLVGRYIFRLVSNIKRMVKNALYGSNYFESMGLTYLGPIDGNDFEAVEHLLREAKKLNESVVVHLKTKKGKGYEPAEQSPEFYHGMSPVCANTAEKRTFSKEMGRWLTERAATDNRICAVTAAMGDGTGLNDFCKTYEKRFFDVGIAEEHALTFCAGLAANGMKPFVAIYSTFLQRGYDNLIHDIALQRLPCVICVDRAGLNVGDGATHHGIFDVAFLSQIPNMRIYTPITLGALDRALEESYSYHDRPSAIRYPNGCESDEVLRMFYPNGEYRSPGIVKSFADQERPNLLIITYGRIVLQAMEAKKKLEADGISVGIVLLEMLKPYEETARQLSSLVSHRTNLIFLEEGIQSGGMGMNLASRMEQEYGIPNDRIRILAIDDSFVEKSHADKTIYDAAGIGAADICRIAFELNAKQTVRGSYESFRL